MTADNLPLLGPSETVNGLWIAEALWVTHASGAAQALAQLMTDTTRGAVAGPVAGGDEAAGVGVGVAVIAWAKVGHGGHLQSFPISVQANLDAHAHSLSLLELPLVPFDEHEAR